MEPPDVIHIEAKLSHEKNEMLSSALGFLNLMDWAIKNNDIYIIERARDAYDKLVNP